MIIIEARKRDGLTCLGISQRLDGAHEKSHDELTDVLSCDTVSPPNDLIRIWSVNRGLAWTEALNGSIFKCLVSTPHSPFPCISHAGLTPPFSPYFLSLLIPFLPLLKPLAILDFVVKDSAGNGPQWLSLHDAPSSPRNAVLVTVALLDHFLYIELYKFPAGLITNI
jgi:hypothetical protein